MRSVVLATVLVAAGAAPAAEPGEWTYPVTHKGKPAAGVKVGFVTLDHSDPNDPKTSAPVFAISDAKGEVRFPRPADPATVGSVLARDPSGRGGYGMLYGANRSPPTVELSDNSELAGRVLDEAGKPVPGLTLKPIALGPESFAQYGNRPVSNAGTPDWFWADFPVKFAADGSFTLAGVPAARSVAVRFEAPGFGSGRFWVLPGRAAPVTLRKSGAVRVTFAAPAGVAPGAVRVVATRTATADWLEVTASTESKGADATLADLPPGQYQISFPYRSAAHFPKAVAPVTVKPGETAAVTTALEPAAKVTARLVDAATGKGVPGAKLALGITVPPTGYIAVPEAVADADGKVERLVPAGMVTAVPRPVAGYAVRKFGGNRFDHFSTEPAPVAAGKVHDFGSFALVKTVELTGIVLGADEKPLAGADVRVGYSGSNSGSVAGPTDAEGRFVVRGLNPEGGVVGLTARKGDATTAAPVGVDPGKPEGEVRLLVSAEYAARVRARALDRAGKPVADAGVELMHMVRYLSLGGGVIGSGSGTKVGPTGADGRFASAVLQPGDRYSATVSAPGYRSATTAEWIAKPGAVHDFGDVILTRADLTVGGTVTDLAGKPVAGATVFDNADGARPAETKTDAAGRFTLGGLYEGAAFVSVRADGFRLASVAAEPGGAAVVVTLRRRTDPPAPAPGVPESQKQATEKLARHVLTAMWENRVAAGDPGKSTIRAMAKLDPALARKWRDEEKARTGGTSDLSAELEAAARDLTLPPTAREDADEAVALLKPVTGIEGFRAVCELADQLLADAPDRALRVAEEAVARARGLEDAERTWALAQAGGLVFRAGKPEAGRKVIEEAAKMAAPLGFADLDGYRRGMVACRVALYDPAACRKMIDPIKGASDFNRYLAMACPRAADHDLATATRWFADFRPDNTFAPHIARQRVAYRIAARKPDEAVEIARGITDRTVRACTLAGLALRLKDRDRAAKLLEDTIDETAADQINHYYNGGRGGTAAVVLFRAQQFGHPDLAGLRDKVLAARTASATRFGLDAEYSFVLALALTDPGTARPLLARFLPDAERAKLDGSQQREALVALALCDPAGAKIAADGILARAVAAKKGYDYSGLDTLAALLCRSERMGETALRSGRLLVDFEEE